MTVDQLVTSFLSLSAAEQDRFLKLIKGLKKEDDKADSSTSFLLYDRLSDALFRAKGVKLPAFPYLCKGTNGRALLESAVRWLGADKMNKRARLALFTLTAEAAVDALRDINRNPRREEVLKIITDIPMLVERALPGYKSSGYLPWMAMNVASGRFGRKQEKQD